MQKTNRLKVVDTFAGAGGFSLGFTLTGKFDIVGAIEQDLWAADTFKHNHPETKVIVDDIRNVCDDLLKETFGCNIDVLLGGPPCQGFSIANKNAGDPKDPRNSLFREFLRAAKVLSPRIVIMENVPNLVKAKTLTGEFVLDIIKKELSDLGYHVQHKILDATDYGVPQIRKRVVIVASKQQLENFFPKATYTTVDKKDLLNQNLPICPTLWDAISDLPDIEACEGEEIMNYTHEAANNYQLAMRDGCTKVYNHQSMRHSKRMVERFKAMKWGDSTSDVPEDLKPLKRNGNGEKSSSVYGQNNRRMHPFKQCHTIAASFYANFVHPYKNRNFTAREGARIQSFPDWYVFLGKPTTASHSLLKKEGRQDEIHLCQYNQIGNAVPPLMAQAIAENLYNQIQK